MSLQLHTKEGNQLEQRLSGEVAEGSCRVARSNGEPLGTLVELPMLCWEEMIPGASNPSCHWDSSG
jgi:hypothetical protein